MSNDKPHTQGDSGPEDSQFRLPSPCVRCGETDTLCFDCGAHLDRIIAASAGKTYVSDPDLIADHENWVRAASSVPYPVVRVESRGALGPYFWFLVEYVVESKDLPPSGMFDPPRPDELRWTYVQVGDRG